MQQCEKNNVFFFNIKACKDILVEKYEPENEHDMSPLNQHAIMNGLKTISNLMLQQDKSVCG